MEGKTIQPGWDKQAPLRLEMAAYWTDKQT